MGVLFGLPVILIHLFFDRTLSLWGYASLTLFVYYVGRYFYQLKNKYLTIENGEIYKNTLFTKKMNLTDIKQIKKCAGYYTLKTEKTELTIHADIIEEKSLANLNLVLDELNLLEN